MKTFSNKMQSFSLQYENAFIPLPYYFTKRTKIMERETWSIGNIKATHLNPHSLAVWPDGVGVGDVASPICIVSPIEGLTDSDIQHARIIAAAPELLAALMEVVAISDRKHDAWDRAKAAIAKATKTELEK